MFNMRDLTLIIPAKKEVESLPVFLKEIENYKCKKFVVLQKEDLETKEAIRKIMARIKHFCYSRTRKISKKIDR